MRADITTYITKVLYYMTQFSWYIYSQLYTAGLYSVLNGN